LQKILQGRLKTLGDLLNKQQNHEREQEKEKENVATGVKNQRTMFDMPDFK
jgi:hypothetical protein